MINALADFADDADALNYFLIITNTIMILIYVPIWFKNKRCIVHHIEKCWRKRKAAPKMKQPITFIYVLFNVQISLQ
ncbi:hypothetical protein EG344_04665 [Chryseobacterium sp. G0162]|nr:hypothetical protein EG344_04665 [Chryseobacterium sp. G0162]